MTEKKTRASTAQREELVRKIEAKANEKMLSKVVSVISDARNIAYHDKRQIIRELRDAFNEPG